MSEYYLDQTYYIIYYSINIKYMWTEPKSGSPRDLMDKVLLCDIIVSKLQASNHVFFWSP